MLTKTSEMVLTMVLEGRSDREIAGALRASTLVHHTLGYLDSLESIRDASLDGAVDYVQGQVGPLDETAILVVRQTINREQLNALGARDGYEDEAEQNESERRDRLVSINTAFGSWDELIGALEAGYVPTLRAGMSEGIDELARLVQAEGFQVWRGTNAKREELSALQAWAEAELDVLDAAEANESDADVGPTAAGEGSETGSAVERSSAVGDESSAVVFRATLD